MTARLDGKSKRTPTGGLVVLFGLAVLVRAIGVWWGATYGDERPSFAARVLVGELVPPDHFYPPLLYYVDALAYGVLFVVGRLTVMWHDLGEFRAAFFDRPYLFSITCRLVVAFISALTGPIAVLAARRLGVSRGWAWAVGVVVALHPVNVWLAHVSKPQMPMTTGVFLMALALLAALDAPRRRGPWLGLGVAAGIAVAFKQTAAFFALSMTLTLFVTQLVVHRERLGELVLRAALSGAVALLVWAPLSIGVLLDLERFLAYQQVQAAMSNRSAPVSEIAGTLGGLLSSTLEGATWPGLVLGILAPLARRTPKHLALFASNALALLIVVLIAGPRMTSGLLLPFSGLLLLQGVVLASDWANARAPGTAWVGRLAVAACFGFGVWGTGQVLKQALAPPMGKRVAEVLRRLDPPDGPKVMVSQLKKLGLPVSFEAQQVARARHERLARKYGVALPPQPEERQRPRPRQRDALHLVEVPWSIHGLEVYDEDSVAELVQAFAWPIQKEEWNLEYWTERGYDTWVVMDAPLIDEVPTYRAFFERLEREAELVAELETERELFFETRQRIFRLPEDFGATTATTATSSSAGR